MLTNSQPEIAYASSAIQTRDINGGASDPLYLGPNFKFAKLLSMPFFGAGMVDLTPGGIKRSKNSRRMQMVFFVVYGRVTVEIGNDIDSPKQSFGIGKGGVWQVPRGECFAFSFCFSSIIQSLATCLFSGWERIDEWKMGHGALYTDIEVLSPLGNWYAVHNHSDKYPARIFFAQGCHMPQPSPDAAASAANNGAEASEAR